LIAQLLVLGTSSDASSTGLVGCECIAMPESTANASGGCFTVLTTQGAFCYPPTYGSAVCAPHDAGLAPYCDGSTQRPFCTENWCWVDPSTCHSSGVTYGRSTYRPGLHFSYRTCGGDPTLWKNVQVAEQLSGVTLTAALPMSHALMHYHSDPAGLPIVTIDDNHSAPVPAYSGGYAVTYWADLARAGGFRLEWRLISSGNRAQHPSSWTACVADVADGLIDVCPSITWMTPGRLGMATFTQPVRLANFFLMVPKPKPLNDFRTKFSFMFQPFTVDAWICVIGCVVIIGVLTVYLQPPELTEEDGAHAGGEGANEGAARAKGRRCATLARVTHPRVLDALQDNIHATFMEFVGAGSDVDPDHVTAVKFVKSGWAVFVLLILTAYTASFTAFLVTNTYNQPITGIDSCRAVRCTVCMTAYLADEMRTIYSNDINYRIEPRTNTALTFFTWGYEQVRAGQCDAALIDVTGYEEDPSKQACDMMFVGTQVLQIFTGFAAKPEYADALSYWIRQLSWSAEASHLEDQHRRPILPTMECNPRPNLNAQRSDAMQLSIYDLIAPFIIMCGFVTVGLCVHCLQRYRCHDRCARRAPDRVRPAPPRDELKAQAWQAAAY